MVASRVGLLLMVLTTKSRQRRAFGVQGGELGRFGFKQYSRHVGVPWQAHLEQAFEIVQACVR